MGLGSIRMNEFGWANGFGLTLPPLSNMELFLNNEEVTDEENIYLGESSSTRVAGRGNVILKLTSSMSLASHHVLHVHNM